MDMILILGVLCVLMMSGHDILECCNTYSNKIDSWEMYSFVRYSVAIVVGMMSVIHSVPAPFLESHPMQSGTQPKKICYL